MKSTIALLLTLLSISSLAQNPTEPTVYIPVVVHVIGSGIASEVFPTDPQIMAKINDLNAIFNGTHASLTSAQNIGIQFRLAKLSPNCASTTGIDRVSFANKTIYKENGVKFETSMGISEVELKRNTQWEIAQYLNIWIVNKIDNIDSGAFTWMPTQAAGKDGIVITSKDFMDADFSVFVNQVGRFFNLYNLWENLIPNASVFCGNDSIADTDPVEFYSGLARTGTNPCTNTPYTDATERNFMSYNVVRSLFTLGQKMRMRASLELPNRKSLVNSIADDVSSCVFNSTNTPVLHIILFQSIHLKL